MVRRSLKGFLNHSKRHENDKDFDMAKHSMTYCQDSRKEAYTIALLAAQNGHGITYKAQRLCHSRSFVRPRRLISISVQRA